MLVAALGGRSDGRLLNFQGILDSREHLNVSCCGIL